MLNKLLRKLTKKKSNKMSEKELFQQLRKHTRIKVNSILFIKYII